MNKNLPFLWGFYLISFMGVLSSSSWFMLWVFIELNTLSFIPIILSSKTKKNGEATLLYFITQGISSMYLLMSLMNEESLMSSIWEPNSLLLVAVFLKLSAGFFFNWLYLLSYMLLLPILLLILTIQKLSPFIMLMCSQHTFSLLMLLFVISSYMLGSMLNLTQNNMKMLMTVSGLSNLSWMLIALTLSVSTWIYYFLIYSASLMVIFYISGVSMQATQSEAQSAETTMSFLSLGGLPPFPGFFPKLVILSSASYNALEGLMLMMLFMACLDIYIYLNFSYSTSMKSNSAIIWLSKHSGYTSMLSTMMLTSVAVTGLITIW